MGFGDCLDGGFSPVENGVDIYEEVGDWEEQVLEVDSKSWVSFLQISSTMGQTLIKLQLLVCEIIEPKKMGFNL